jgi:hypothetical protein
VNFSKRMGIEPIEPPLQLDSMSKELRNLLWNAVYGVIGVGIVNYSNFDISARGFHLDYSFNLNAFRERIWVDILKQPRNTLKVNVNNPNPDIQVNQIHKIYNLLAWDKVYEFFELLLSAMPEYYRGRVSDLLNKVLAAEHSGYRLIDGQFMRITDENELKVIEVALTSTGVDRFAAVHEQLRTALELFNKKPEPDYRNSIKESISAVEGICKLLTGEKSGGIEKALTKLGGIHPAMRAGFKKLYAYTSDEDGIRHAMLDEPNIGLAEAKYMLVICSAFVYFVIMKLPPEKQL